VGVACANYRGLLACTLYILATVFPHIKLATRVLNTPAIAMDE